MKILKANLFCVVALGLVSTALFGMMPAAHGQAFYVSPAGSDSAPGTESAPFQSLAAAQSAVRASSSAATNDITVYLVGGLYRLNAPLVFTGDDSGQNGHRISYKAVLGQTPVLNGGMLITNWTVHDADRNIWRAAVPPGSNFRQFYVNGIKANLSRSADALGLVQTNTGYSTTNALLLSMAGTASATNLEVVTIPHEWQQEILPVAAIGADGSITLQEPCWSMVQNDSYPSYHSPVWLQNAYGLMANPGDWYLDPALNVVYYMPRPGDDMTSAVAEAPVIERLISLAGTSNNPVCNLRFEGLALEMTTWLLVGPGYGLPEIQANQPEANSSNWVMKAAVDGSWLRNVDVSQCEFRHLGGDGVNVLCGSKNVAVDHCLFYDLAGSAVQLALGWRADGRVPATDPSIVEKVVVANNTIHDVCTDYISGCGIYLGFTRGCSILHNRLYNLPYSGISIGWGWNSPPCAFNSCNWIDGNVIHDHTQILNDGGAIYANGGQMHATISHNYVYNQHCQYWGTLYIDDGSSNWSVFENVATKGGATAWISYKGVNNRIWGNYSDNSYARSLLTTNCSCNNNSVVANANWASNSAASAITNASGPQATVYYSSLPAASLIDATNGNGSFYQGLTGWTIGPPGGQNGVGYGYYADPNTPAGNNSVHFSAGNKPPGGTLSTTFNAVAGHTYALAYSQATWGTTHNQNLAVSATDATGTNTITLGASTTWVVGLYARFGAVFTATNSGTWTLTFTDMTTSANGNSADCGLARVELRDVTQVITPSLMLEVSGGSAVIRWPVVAAGFNLYSAPSVGPGAGWTPVTDPAPVIDPANTNLLKVVVPTADVMFYRLQQ